MTMTEDELKAFLEKVMDVARKFANEEKNLAFKRKSEITKLVEIEAAHIEKANTKLENLGAA